MYPTQPPRELSITQRQLLTNYITQYNQTNAHIDMLINMLDEISANIVTILNTQQTRRTMRRNASSSPSSSASSAPITPSASSASSASSSSNNLNYYNTPNPRHNYYNYNLGNSVYDTRAYYDDMTNLFSTFLNTPVQIRPTHEQIESASILVKYEDIENPCSEVCPISLEPFTSNSEVRQLLHCGHIFNPTQFQTWFSSHVKCPVCRHDIRHNGEDTHSNEDVTASSSSAPNTSSSNQTLNSLIDQVATNLFQSVLNPNNNEGFMVDPSNNIMYYETIIRPNRNNL
jgi:hypothetical protein